MSEKVTRKRNIAGLKPWYISQRERQTVYLSCQYSGQFCTFTGTGLDFTLVYRYCINILSVKIFVQSFKREEYRFS